MKVVLFKGGKFAFDPLHIDNFKPTKSVAICYMVCNGKVLLLKKNDPPTVGDRWCMPGGKLEKNETPLQAVVREIKEETAILLLPEATDFIQTICIRIFTPKQDYLLHLFKVVLPRAQPSDYTIVLNHEHMGHLWADLETAKQLNLLAGGKAILEALHTTTGW
ncbi:NUDIX domain-containing protein [Cardinium endosymbiont of Bemisia tabaci]|uniref:NUDIX domain-containing protein n=1 Tax=Cardinium endosymbiont of Bemisia tabaci TaxID=672794 RepID=UPI000442D35D|nr:NUDIX domain-containing protein [Cardinium endosymbiont of Bemisia tabaci]CDG49498.1 Uncharacterized Nudix hydrolase yvcI [Cardinium endosymbiont cBtQ1 of Bemisia tabaci]